MEGGREGGVYFIALSHTLHIIFKNLPFFPEETGAKLMGKKLYLVCIFHFSSEVGCLLIFITCQHSVKFV